MAALQQTHRAKAIDALVNLIATSQNEDIRYLAASSLGQIAVGNESAIAALVNLIATSQNEVIRYSAASSLGQIAVGNESAIAALVNLIANSQDKHARMLAAPSLEKILPADRMAKVVTDLRYDFKPDKDRDRAIWPCAQNMSYSAFYEAWHPPFDIKIAIRYLYPWWPVLCLFLVLYIFNLVCFNVAPNLKSPTDIQRQQQIREF